MDDKSDSVSKKNYTCLACGSSKNIDYHFLCQVDGKKMIIARCIKCREKVSITSLEPAAKKNSITGIRCRLCNGERKEKWFIANYASPAPEIMSVVSCSAKCDILQRRQVELMCANCSKSNSSTERHICSGCGSKTYCSVECQKIHWKSGHKNECAELAENMRLYIINNNVKETCYNCFKQSTKRISTVFRLQKYCILFRSMSKSTLEVRTQETM